MILGVAFLGVKAKEYHDKYEECHIPGHIIGKGFNTWGGCSATDPKLGNIADEIRERNPKVPEVAAVEIAKQTEIFFSFYFAMTGLHAFHMIIGFGLLAGCSYGRGAVSSGPNYYTPMELGGLYWHFVDIVWIYLFPLLYLISRTRT